LPVRRHSPTAWTAYNDLLATLLDDAVGGVRGAPTRRERGGRTYWYDRYRLGGVTKERYLGEDTAELRRRLDAHAALSAQRADRRRERARLVRLLRAERFLGLDATTGSLLAAMSRAGVFRLGGVVVGTNAFRLYEGELGVRLALDQAATTNDVDIASFEKLSLVLSATETVDPPLADVLRDFDFAAVPSLEPPRVWRWRQTRGEAFVEFLTPSFSEVEDLRPLPALGVTAQSLHYLNFLIREPIAAAGVYRDGILVRIPRPERFAIHKLIVADRRVEGTDSLKARKDRLQAAFLIEVLVEDRPTDLAEALEEARSQGSSWRRRLEATLQRMPTIADALDAVAG
jgi:hypothetical protein